MPTSVVVNGTTYQVPNQGETYDWGSGNPSGTGLTNFFAALAANTLQPTVPGNTFNYTGSLGFGVSPGQKIHIFNGNVLFESGNGQQTALIFKQQGAVGSQNNPLFSWGRMVAAGVGLPTVRVVYSDDSTAERTIFSQESSGTIAAINDNTRRSHYEAYGFDGQVDPDFRINGYTGVSGAGTQYEFGRGGCRSVAGQTTRSSNTVTVHTDQPHCLVVGDTINRAAAPGTTDPGFPNISNASLTVASVADSTHFTYSETAANATNVQNLLHSTGTDTYLQLAGKYQLACIMGGSTKWTTYADSFVTASGVGATYGGSVIYVPTAVSSTPYSLQSGSQFFCDATSGAITFNLPAANGYYGKPGRTVTIKKIDSGSNHVTITRNGTDLIDGASTYSLSAQYKYVTLSSDGSANWYVIANN